MSTTDNLQKLLNIMTQLRDPNHGCEWDRVQTFKSITPHTLDEVYEVIEAINQENFIDLKEELGDLLYQIVFYSEMAREQNHFNFDDVMITITDKLIWRHPHIFVKENGQKAVSSKVEWEILKQAERLKKNQTSLLDDIPKALPALLRANKTQKRAASVGFDWEQWQPAFDKVLEELDEVKTELNKVDLDKEHLEEELGDLLFSVVNLSRHLKCNPEITLNRATDKFERRFRAIEQKLEADGKSIENCNLTELDQLWDQVKQEEQSK